MEPFERLARLETHAEYFQAQLTRVEEDCKELRGDLKALALRLEKGNGAFTLSTEKWMQRTQPTMWPARIFAKPWMKESERLARLETSAEYFQMKVTRVECDAKELRRELDALALRIVGLTFSEQTSIPRA